MADEKDFTRVLQEGVADTLEAEGRGRAVASELLEQVKLECLRRGTVHLVASEANAMASFAARLNKPVDADGADAERALRKEIDNFNAAEAAIPQVLALNLNLTFDKNFRPDPDPSPNLSLTLTSTLTSILTLTLTSTLSNLDPYHRRSPC